MLVILRTSSRLSTEWVHLTLVPSSKLLFKALLNGRTLVSRSRKKCMPLRTWFQINKPAHDSVYRLKYIGKAPIQSWAVHVEFYMFSKCLRVCFVWVHWLLSHLTPSNPGIISGSAMTRIKLSLKIKQTNPTRLKLCNHNCAFVSYSTRQKFGCT